MEPISGRAGELVDRLVLAVDEPGPQLRAVATTLLIKAVDLPAEELQLMEDMVASDAAAAMIDRAAAAEAGLRLRHRLVGRLGELAGLHGEAPVVRAMRDHLRTHVERWATRAVDDADNRRRAERFLAWAERPHQLEAAQRRGLFAGMTPEELRQMARSKADSPVTPETALEVWAEVDRWTAVLDQAVGDQAIAAWERSDR